jgi:hypothetical protein
MSRLWIVEIATTPSELDRRIAVCLNWAFLRHVLPDSQAVNAAIALMDVHDLRSEAEAFYVNVIPKLGDKLTVIQFFFDWFFELPRHRASIEYLNSTTEVMHSPIPS